ncbi:unnamed protein product [Effrenium voratum]|nr:unnamed protein product [Effrenium voratum]
MGDVRLVIEQISGQTWEGRAFRTELVESLKDRVALPLAVPAMCQRLLAADYPETTPAQVFEALAARMQRLVMSADRRHLAEILSFANPPAALQACVALVVHLIRNHEYVEKHAGSRNELDWDCCKRLLFADPPEFLKALHDFPGHLLDSKVSDSHVAAAEECLQTMGKAFLPQNMKRISTFGATLVEWAALAIKVFKMWQEEKTATTSALELDDFIELGAYVGGASELRLSLLCDVELLWSSLELGTEVILPAVEALEVVGHRCRDRAISALCRLLSSENLEVRRAARVALRRLEVQASELLGTLRPWRPERLDEVFAALIEFAPQEAETLEWLLFATREQPRGPDRYHALRAIETAPAGCFGASALALAPADDEGAWLVICRVAQKVAETDPAKAAELLLMQLQGAWAVSALDLALELQLDLRFQEAMVARLPTLQGQMLMAFCSRIDLANAKPQVAQALLAELARPCACEEVLMMLARCMPEEEARIIPAIRSFLAGRHASSTGAVLAAAEIAQLASAECERRSLRRQAMLALARRLAKGQKCGADLERLMQTEGLTENVQAELLLGLSSQQASVQRVCGEVFWKVVRKGDQGVVQVLMRDIQEEGLPSLQRAHLIELLGQVACPGQSDVVQALQTLAGDAQLVIREAAAGALGLCGLEDADTRELLRGLLTDPDAQVRLTSLQCLARLPHLDLPDQLLHDDATSVVLLALELSASPQLSDLVRLAAHGDPRVRALAVRRLGRVKAVGAEQALKALWAQPLPGWEVDPQVLAAREEALKALT